MKITANKVSIWASILSVPSLISWYLDHVPSIHAQVPAWTGFASLSLGVALAITALVANAIAHVNLGRLLEARERHSTPHIPLPSEPAAAKGSANRKTKEWANTYWPMMEYQPPSERIFVNKTPQELTTFFTTFLDAQAGKLIQPYIGKWLRIAGPVNNAAQYESTFWQVFINIPQDNSIFGIQVVLYFADTWTERLSLITRDTNIAVIGRINKVSAGGLELQACELVQ